MQSFYLWTKDILGTEELLKYDLERKYVYEKIQKINQMFIMTSVFLMV